MPRLLDGLRFDPQPHGGRLRAAAKEYGVPLADWIDLSTGINPNGWPVPNLPSWAWSRLPEEDDGLEAAARAYYGAEHLLPVAGSQAAIQALPRLLPASRVRVIAPAYNEHAAAWRQAGHQVEMIAATQIDAALADTDVLVVINPNNPTGHSWSREDLLQIHEQLASRDACLLVDEAFADVDPARSLVPFASRPGLIVLRSLGKFFGLAGLRVGFVCAQLEWLTALRSLLGPWHVSGPARWVATAALRDREWQESARHALQKSSKRLQALLCTHGLAPAGSCALFQWLPTSAAADLHRQLARRGILTRLFAEHTGLRLGLPGDESQWQRLHNALAELKRDE